MNTLESGDAGKRPLGVEVTDPLMDAVIVTLNEFLRRGRMRDATCWPATMMHYRQR